MKLVQTLFILSCLIFGGTQLSAQSVHKSLMSGDKAYQQSAYAVAELEYRRAEREGNNYKALYNLGNTLAKQERYDEAAEYFNRAIALAENPQDKYATQYNLANAHLYAGKVEDAILFYKEAIKTDPSSSEARYNLAVAKDALRQAKEQQEQQQQQEEQQEGEPSDEEQSEDQENQEQQEQDGEKQDGEKQDGEKKDGEKEDEEEKEEGEEQEGEQEGEESEGEEGEGSEVDSSRLEKQSLDSLDAMKLLQIIQDEESKVQEKLKKFNSERSKSDKDW